MARSETSGRVRGHCWNALPVSKNLLRGVATQHLLCESTSVVVDGAQVRDCIRHRVRSLFVVAPPRSWYRAPSPHKDAMDSLDLCRCGSPLPHLRCVYRWRFLRVPDVGHHVSFRLRPHGGRTGGAPASASLSTV